MNVIKCKVCGGKGYTNKSKVGKTYEFALYECNFCEGKGFVKVLDEKEKNIDNFVSDVLESRHENVEPKKRRGRPSLEV